MTADQALQITELSLDNPVTPVRNALAAEVRRLRDTRDTLTAQVMALESQHRLDVDHFEKVLAERNALQVQLHDLGGLISKVMSSATYTMLKHLYHPEETK